MWCASTAHRSKILCFSFSAGLDPQVPHVSPRSAAAWLVSPAGHLLQHMFARHTSDATPPRYTRASTATMPTPCAAFVWVTGIVTRDPRLKKDRNERSKPEEQRPLSYALHLTVVLSKAALSGPSVCERERHPCLLAVSQSPRGPCGAQYSCGCRVAS